MFAVSVCRPWVTLTMLGYRPLLCRVNRPPPGLLGQRIAIHSRRHWDPLGAAKALEVLGRELTPDDCPIGLLGTVELVHCYADGELPENLRFWDRHPPYKWLVSSPLTVEPFFHRGEFNVVWEAPRAFHTPY